MITTKTHAIETRAHRRAVVYRSKTGNFSTSAAALQPYLDAEITSPFQLAVEARTNATFNATVTYGNPPDELRVRVREDRLVRVSSTPRTPRATTVVRPVGQQAQSLAIALRSPASA